LQVDYQYHLLSTSKKAEDILLSMNMTKFAALAVTFLAVAVVSASKDNNYYPGFTNPNLSEEMYWADAVNVLEDIQSFDSLYIKFTGCVWSEYGMGEDHGEYYDDDEEEDDGANCGGSGGYAHWYMGRTACFRANAAYELYGIPSGSSKSSGCHKGTYINSFFTRLGPEIVADAFGLDNSVVNVKCETISGGVDDEYQDGDDGWGGAVHNTLADTSSSSMATGCSSSGRFQLDMFQGAYCDGLHYTETVTSASDLDSYSKLLFTMINTVPLCPIILYISDTRTNKLTNSLYCTCVLSLFLPLPPYRLCYGRPRMYRNLLLWRH
jgi:hypothetical protein